MIVFRETFQTPLSKTVNGLRSMVRSESPELKVPGARIPVVQRLKRREQIISKLVRLPETKLSNMGDIGGCRAILQTRALGIDPGDEFRDEFSGRKERGTRLL